MQLPRPQGHDDRVATGDPFLQERVLIPVEAAPQLPGVYSDMEALRRGSGGMASLEAVREGGEPGNLVPGEQYMPNPKAAANIVGMHAADAAVSGDQVYSGLWEGELVSGRHVGSTRVPLVSGDRVLSVGGPGESILQEGNMLQVGDIL